MENLGEIGIGQRRGWELENLGEIGIGCRRGVKIFIEELKRSFDRG